MTDLLDLNHSQTAHHYMAAMQVIHNLPPFSWYDSYFLAKFEAAKQFLDIVSPLETARFVQSFDILRTNPKFQLQHLKNFLSTEKRTDILKHVEKIQPDLLKSGERASFGRNVFHDLPVLRSLQQELTPLVSELAGEAVEPDYSFLSLYYGEGVCLPHLDAPSAKWTLDICLEQSCEWPIYFSPIEPWPEADAKTREINVRNLETIGSTFAPHTLKPNDALLFSGSSQWHYRDKIPDEGFCHLAFLHYRPAGSENLIKPEKWAKHFDLPELQVFNITFDKIRPTSAA